MKTTPEIRAVIRAERTKAALAALDAHGATHQEMIDGDPDDATARSWLAREQQLIEAVGEAVAADTAELNDALVARRVARTGSGLAWLRGLVSR